MPTLIQHLDGESADYLRQFAQAIYLDGECYAFALALHEGLGWPLVGLVDGDTIRHAAVRSPDGRLMDVRGFVPAEEFVAPFGLSAHHLVREIVVDDLNRKDEPELHRRHSINNARMLAEAIWPELPWQNSLASRVKAFCDELEKLSKEHGLWISSPYPAARPVFAAGEGDEGGYSICPTIGGITFTVDRHFK